MLAKSILTERQKFFLTLLTCTTELATQICLINTDVFGIEEFEKRKRKWLYIRDPCTWRLSLSKFSPIRHITHVHLLLMNTYTCTDHSILLLVFHRDEQPLFEQHINNTVLHYHNYYQLLITHKFTYLINFCNWIWVFIPVSLLNKP